MDVSDRSGVDCKMFGDAEGIAGGTAFGSRVCTRVAYSCNAKSL